jgi:hypothetical protein
MCRTRRCQAGLDVADFAPGSSPECRDVAASVDQLVLTTIELNDPAADRLPTVKSCVR